MSIHRNTLAVSKSLRRFLRVARTVSLLLVTSFLSEACFYESNIELYYGRVVVPRAQELRWSDGGVPQVFDPALAAVAPDTDAVRALFEGLTDYDARTLGPIPGVATSWTASTDYREWTFHLRNSARWSTGEAVTAHDFVRSWRRTLELGLRAPHVKLMNNIVGAKPLAVNDAQPTALANSDQLRAIRRTKRRVVTARRNSLAVEAIDDYTLRVRLVRPDRNFAALVAHPVFRPVHGADRAQSDLANAESVVSNGAFRLITARSDAVVLQRDDSYWDAATVSLERVRFVATNSAEDALAAYHQGDVDAVTNAGFESLALKLLAPYRDFRRATFNALTYYCFNTAHAPFDDARVRLALSLSVDRERLSRAQMDNTTEPAMRFLPFASQSEASTPETSVTSSDESIETRLTPPTLRLDVAQAQSLLADAGFPEGQGFPRIRLIVNRNEQQRRVAEAVAAMWHNALRIETDVIVKNWDDYETAVRVGDYDVVRRGIVMQTTDEAINMHQILESPMITAEMPATTNPHNQFDAARQPTGATNPDDQATAATVGRAVVSTLPEQPLLTEVGALRTLPAVPLYWASSFGLVKPYVAGFDANLFDAPSLKRVRIDQSWRAPEPTPLIQFTMDEPN